jgi:Hypoxia induced protein conserved region
MSAMSNLAVAIAIGAVALVLELGLVNMLRQGAGNRSQMLMRWRVGLQFAAIVVIVIVLWARSH